MAEYIERDALKDRMAGFIPMFIDESNRAYVDGLTDAYTLICQAPAADVRPVVLCRYCKWCHAGYCEKYDDLIPFGCANKPWEDWFCADGKKKEES